MGSVPSRTHLVWPVTARQVRVRWDADAPFSGTIGWAPAQTMHLAYEPLTTVRVGIDGEGIRFPIASDVQPRLAVDWEPSPDFRSWTIRLRPGVRSHAGNELTADDIVWSWRRAFALRGLGIWRSRRVAGVGSPDAVEALDRHTVRFTLTGPNPEFPQFLIFSTNMVIDSIEARRNATEADPWATAWLSANVAGFGAFNLAEHTTDSITVTARDDYWLGRPGLDAVTQIGVDRREQAMRLLERGEVNVILNAYPEELARFGGRPEYTVHRVRGNHSSLDLDWRRPPFDDLRIRQAVAYALPWERIFRDVYQGDAKPCRSPVSPASQFATDEFWTYPTDLTQAREILRTSSAPDGFATDLWIVPSAESLRFGEVVREALREIGIVVAVRVGHPDGNAPMRFRDECGHALTEAMYDLAHDYDPPAGMRQGFDEKDRVWAERLRAIRSAPAEEQPELYRTIQRDLVDFCGIIPIAELQTGWIVREPLDPWALGSACLAVNTTVWGGHRWDLGVW